MTRAPSLPYTRNAGMPGSAPGEPGEKGVHISTVPAISPLVGEPPPRGTGALP
ncbi:hypothetical protein SAMN05216551_11114 [Chitinasiproducens palmae]|uniref:Uncharacterized protein n=1 Tax=Chitinasiproducens palmae TaxID=1770053 RepID=A0A1H2PTX7_9BURK|nr:hypothetical protein SAMN05216551_11114 [Chitinasiproducens palmae]